MDPRTRLLMYKMVNSGLLENINGCISTGKESVVFHANGGRWVGLRADSQSALTLHNHLDCIFT